MKQFCRKMVSINLVLFLLLSLVLPIEARAAGIITYDGNGALCCDGETTWRRGNDGIVLCDVFCPSEAAVLIGWNTRPDGTGQSFAQGDRIWRGGSITLYAQWKPLEANTIAYDGNGARTSDGKRYVLKPVESFRQVTLPGAEAFQAPAGECFLGWRYYEHADEGLWGQTYQPGDVVSFEGPATLQALWGQGRLIYHVNGGTASWEEEREQQAWYEGETILGAHECYFKRNGYLFDSWNTEPDGSGQTYAPGTPIRQMGIVHLYAQWNQVVGNIIVYDGDGILTSEGEPYVLQSVKSFDQVTFLGADVFPAPEGEMFLGWQYSELCENGTVNTHIYQPGETRGFSGTVTLVPLWGQGYFRFYGNGGSLISGETMEEQIFYNSGETAPYIPFVKEGYRLISWNTEPDGSGKTYPIGTEIEGKGILQLYAQWEKPAGTYIVLEGYGASSASGEYSVVHSVHTYEAVVIPDPEVFQAPEDMGLLYWRDVNNDKEYLPGETWRFGGPVTLVARWGSGANVRLHGNGGKTDYDVELKWSIYLGGEEIPDSPFLRNGYKFIGWNTEPDGSGTDWPVGTGVYHAGVLNLYAQWQKISYSGLFLEGNGTKTAAGETYYIHPVDTYDRVIIPDAHMFEAPPNEAFLGWQDDQDQWYLPGEVCALKENVHLIAIWGKANLFYHGNGGRDDYWNRDEVQDVLLWEGQTFSYPYFEKKDWVFSSWNTEPDGSGTMYSVGAKVPPIGICHLYAQWEKPEGEGLLLLGSQTSALNGKNYAFLPLSSYENVTIPDSTLFRDPEDQIFLGWMDEEENYYRPGEIHSFSGQKTLCGLWGFGGNLLFYGNGGARENGETEYNKVVTWVGYDLPNDIFYRKGYHMTGWNTEADGSGKAYPTGTEIRCVGILDLYAQWEAVESGLILEGGGSKTETGQSYQVYPLQSYENIRIPDAAIFHVPEDRCFLGWQDHEENWYLPGEIYSFPGQIVLTAQWGYGGHLIYSGNGGRTDSDQEQIIQVARYSGEEILRNRFRMPGYTFTGWNTEPDGSGKNYYEERSIRKLGILHLYAQWKEDPNAVQLLQFDTEKSDSSAALYVAVYDDRDRMLLAQEAQLKAGCPQTEIPYRIYQKMKWAKLFRMDRSTWKPVGQESVLIKEIK